MAGRRLLLVSALAAALLSNYWLLEGLLADRTDLLGSWISDLSTRSEGSGAVFVALGVAAALALALFALVLLDSLGRRGEWSRRGVLALLGAGLFGVVAAAAPLSCGEGLEASCSLEWDPLDLVHAVATTDEIAATVAAFALLAWGLRTRRAGATTLALGAIWALLTIVTGVSYLSDGVDEVKGAFQRGGQVAFGVWLLALAWAAAGEADAGRPSESPGARLGR